MFKERQQEALAVAEDRSGQEVLQAAESATHLRRLKADFERAKSCKTEDDHVFMSYGMCELCGAHRAPR